MVVQGVEVDFVGEYAFPYFLRRYKGYVVKVVNCICNREVEESNKLSEMGYLPIFIFKIDNLSYVRDKLETEKRNFSFEYTEIEIERDICNIENIKGVVLVYLGKDKTVCCNEFKTKENSVVLQGLSGTLKCMLDGALAMYNRRIV